MNTAQILEHLIGFDTTSSRSNAALIDWVAGFLNNAGIGARILPDRDGGKANLLATIGPAGDDGIILSGHTDVVPAEPLNWHGDPFTLQAREGRFYGRGTTDMKGFLACVLSTVARIDASRLVRPLHIALTHDEEVGCFGAKTLIRHLPPARAIIVGEPTAMRIADRHKGAVAQTIRIKGLSAHSGLPQNGINAIEHAVQIAGCIADIAQDLIETGGDDDTMQPGYSSIQLAAIAGGGATNVIPDHCDLVWQLRCLPGQSPDAVVERIRAAARTVEARMRNRDRSCTITFEPMYDVPPLNRMAGNPATAICRHLLGPQETIGVNFATEAGLYQRAGYAVVVCGPGDMAQGHTDNEYIQMTELGKCENFLAGLVDELSQREWGA